MKIEFKRYKFTPILGWSSSRYDLFSSCKRQYFYNYYPRFAPPSTSFNELKKLKSLTSLPLEVGNVVHHVVEELLKRLQKSSNPIDRERFISYGVKLTEQFFGEKSFIETTFGHTQRVDIDSAKERVTVALTNLLNSPLFEWILEEGVKDSSLWVIEPEGFGETRVDDLKAYCKMDFLLPVNGKVHILDWKSGKKSEKKHSQQLLGYALATKESNPLIDGEDIIPKIVYLYPELDELSFKITNDSIAKFKEDVKAQTQEMYAFCSNIENNRPIPFENFPKSVSGLCKWCSFQEVCERE